MSSFWTNKAKAQHGHASFILFYCLCTGTGCLQAAGWIFCRVYAPADQMLIVKSHLMWTPIKLSAKNVNNCIPRNVKLTFSILCLFFNHSRTLKVSHVFFVLFFFVKPNGGAVPLAREGMKVINLWYSFRSEWACTPSLKSRRSLSINGSSCTLLPRRRRRPDRVHKWLCH